MTVRDEAALAADYAHCESQLRTADRTAWLATLFAPADRRPALQALESFALEVRAVRDKVREPLAGELRIQWWTDALEGEARGDVSGHPVAMALLDAARHYGLSRSALVDFLSCERDALYDEALGTLDDFDEHADRSEGVFVGQQALVLTGSDGGPTGDAARRAGRVLAVVRAIRGLAAPRPHVLLPLALLRARGIGSGEVMLRRKTPEITKAVQALVSHGADELAALRRLRNTIEPAAGPAFLAASLAGALLGRAARQDYDPFAARLDLPQWRKQWILWRASRRNGIL